MSETPAQEASSKQLLERMVSEKQLSPTDAESLARAKFAGQSEEAVLQWLAK